MTRVSRKYALFTRPSDLPVEPRDEHSLALVDGYLGWAELNLERQRCAPRGCTRRRDVAEFMRNTRACCRQMLRSATAIERKAVPIDTSLSKVVDAACRLTAWFPASKTKR